MATAHFYPVEFLLFFSALCRSGLTVRGGAITDPTVTWAPIPILLLMSDRIRSSWLSFAGSFLSLVHKSHDGLTEGEKKKTGRGNSFFPARPPANSLLHCWLKLPCDTCPCHAHLIKERTTNTHMYEADCCGCSALTVCIVRCSKKGGRTIFKPRCF